jgi:hypothetical protein
MAWLQAEIPRIDSRQGGRFFYFSETSRLAQEYTQTRTGDQGPFLGGLSTWGVKMTTYLHPVPRLRIRGAIIYLPPMA